VREIVGRWRCGVKAGVGCHLWISEISGEVDVEACECGCAWGEAVTCVKVDAGCGLEGVAGIVNGGCGE
jgi:hypothetical protein